jgi:hypothetical protein
MWNSSLGDLGYDFGLLVGSILAIQDYYIQYAWMINFHEEKPNLSSNTLSSMLSSSLF